jgi:hypothetical protein
MSTFLLNFKKQFTGLIEQGLKGQTIRATRKDRRQPKPGDDLRLYHGLRTRSARLLLEVKCLRCVSVRMDLDVDDVTVDGQLLCVADRSAFARADGFDGWPSMREFFLDTHNTCLFEGFCVVWLEPATDAARPSHHHEDHQA